MKRLLLILMGLTAAGTSLAQIYVTKSQFFTNSVTNEGVALGYPDQFSSLYTWNAIENEMKKIGGVSAGNGVGGTGRFTHDGKWIFAPMMSDSIPVLSAWKRSVYPNFSDFVITDVHRKANGALIATASTPDGKAGILLSSKDGQVWQRADYDGCFSTGLTAAASMNYAALFLGGHDGQLYYSRNEGASYTPKDARPEGVTDEIDTYRSINFIPNGSNKSQFGVFGVQLAAGSGAVYYTTDYAVSTAVAEGVAGVPAHITNDGTRYFMVTDNGHIQCSADSGQTWTDLFRTADGSALKRICFSDAECGVALADGCIYLTNDGGNSWSQKIPFGLDINPFAATVWNGVEYVDDVITLVGSMGEVARSTDGGANFERVDIGGSDAENYAAVISTGEYYAVLADYGTFYSISESGVISGACAAMYDVENESWRELPTLGYGKDLSVTSPYQISGNGLYGVGMGGVYYEPTNEVQYHAVMWDIAYDKITDLGSKFADQGRSSRANAVSFDGSVVAGWQDIYGPWYAALWRRGADGTYTQQLLLLDPTKGEDELDYSNYTELDSNLMGYAFAVSSDGRWIGGSGGERNAFGGPWLYNEEEGYLFLSETQGCVSDISNDGSMAIGWEGLGNSAWIWFRNEDGNGGKMYNLNNYARDVLGLDLGDFYICSAYDLSPNGRYVTGYGMSGLDKFAYVLDLQGNQSGIAAKEAGQVKAAVYPNPAAVELHVDLPFGSDELATTLSLVDMQGHTVRRIARADRSNVMQVASLTPGVYVLNVDCGGRHKSFKVLISH